jgi:hypothetical protein
MTTDSTSQARVIPYVGATGWLTRLHEIFQRSVPARVDTAWLTVAGRISDRFSKTNAQHLRTFMQKVGWIDQEGNVLDEGRNLRLTGQPYQEAMRRTLERIYPDLLEQMQSAVEFTPVQVETFFMSVSSMGKSGRSQMIAVFRWFLREGGLEDLEQKVWAGRRQPAATPRINGAAPRRTARQPATKRHAPSAQPATPPAAAPPAGADGTTPEPPPADQRLATISSVLQINIDGSWDEARMKAAFRWLDQLLKGDTIGD